MTTETQQLLADLRTSYDATAVERNTRTLSGWKARERDVFLRLLQRENRQTLLELGAGPGHDALYFHEKGLTVTAVDNSPAMVQFCREKGVDARVMNVMALDFPTRHFDAIYTMNCLLHVPHRAFTAVLNGIGRVLKPGGLFFLGQHGGIDREGTWPDDHHRPRRFFALFRTDELVERVNGRFQIEQVRKIYTPSPYNGPRMHFQLLICRNPQPRESTQNL